MRSVLIRGEGIAAHCCSRLFGEAGIAVKMQACRRPNLPAIMLGETTQKLLRDVFNRDDLLAGFLEVRRRVVAWEPKRKPVVLPHSAVVASEKELIERIQSGLAQTAEAGCEEAPWT